jgi:hypothetical protein
LSFVAALAGCNNSKLAATSSNIEVSPSELVYEQVLPGGSLTKVVTVTNRGGSALSIDALEIGGLTPASFSADAGTAFPLTLARDEWVAIQVTYAPGELGDHEGVLTIFSSDNGTPTVDVPLLTTPISGDIDAQPNPLQFGSVTVNQPSTQQITITNVGSADLAVSGATLGAGTSAWFTLNAGALPATLTPNQSITVDVTFTPLAQSAVTGTVEITSDDPDEPVAVVALGGTGTTQPVPDISAQNAINFGQVERLTCSAKTATISNTGSATLNITSISKSFWTSSEYTFSPSSMNIAAGGSATLNVTYCPVDTGIDLGQLVLASNDPDENPFNITLSGEGIPPPLSETDIAIEVTWDKNDTDIDTHFVRPGGTFNAAPGDCYFSNLSPDWGISGDATDDPYLDYDDIDGYGPENLNYAKPATGTYRVYMWYYSDHGNGATNVTVKVWLDGATTPVYQGTRNMNMSGSRKWTIGDVAWNAPGDTGTWTTIDTLSSSFGLLPDPPKN